MALSQLSLINISKSFGPINVLNNLSFDIFPGQIIGLLGDNGAGKSTLIKIIAGFHPPSSGTLLWNNQPIDLDSFTPQKARSLGIQTVYQHLGLVDQLSIARNFFLQAELTTSFGPFKKLNHKLMYDIVKSELDLLGLKRNINPDDSIAKLSGGERQAIAISRARYFGAKLLILDEPTSALSVGQTEKVLNSIREAAQQGIAVIFITHTLYHIEKIVDSVVILHRGAIVSNQPTQALSEKDCAELIMHGHYAPT